MKIADLIPLSHEQVSCQKSMQAVRKTKTNEICTATKIVLSQGKQQCLVCAQGKQQKYCIDMDHSLGSFTVFFVLGCASHCSQSPSSAAPPAAIEGSSGLGTALE
jgi:hypothetical protein